MFTRLTNTLRPRLAKCGRLRFTLVAACCMFSQAAFAASVTVHDALAYKSGNGLSEYERERSMLDLYVPDGVSDYPVIVWFYGGALRAGEKADNLNVGIANTLASAGVAVAVVDYRLSPRTSFPGYVDDAAASVAWVLENIESYGGDSAGVFVSGHSAGGYLAAMGGVDEAYLAAYGHEIQELAGLIPISGQMVTHATVRAERGLPEDRPILDAAAPAYHVRADAPPFLAIAGSEDLPARPEENRYFIAAMQAVEHPDATYLEFEGRTHGSIVTGIPDDDDAVATAIMDFVAGRFRGIVTGR